jgi:acetyltransferase-like isoleucine patch superfamily enzyme
MTRIVPGASTVWTRLKRARRDRGTLYAFKGLWAAAWMQLTRWRWTRGVGTSMASIGSPPYYGRQRLAGLTARGYCSRSARIYHRHLHLGRSVYVADGVTIYEDRGGGAVTIGDLVRLHDSVYLQTGEGGNITIGSRTHIQAHCHISAYASSVNIGSRVQIAPRCGIYPYDHSFTANTPIDEQPFTTRGPIEIGDGAWLGFGAIVLSGVHIGEGAVIGAGSVVIRDVPAMAIAAGNPARIVGYRSGGGEGQHDPGDAAQPDA